MDYSYELGLLAQAVAGSHLGFVLVRMGCSLFVGIGMAAAVVVGFHKDQIQLAEHQIRWSNHFDIQSAAAAVGIP